MDKISVIIPAYNAQGTIEKCLYSILNNSTEDKFEFEVIVVNDGSKDNTKNIVEEISKRDTRVKLLDQQNQGPSAARKNGIECATGEYLSFCDSDDWVEPDWLLCMYNTLKNTDADVSIIRSIYTRSEYDRGSHSLFTWTKDEAIESFLKRDRINGSLVVKMFKRSFFNDIDWDPMMKYFEDDILMWQILQKCNKVVKLDSGKYHIELREDSLTASKFSSNRLSSTNKLFDRIITDCSNTYLRHHLNAARDFRYHVYNAHFRLMFRDNYHDASEEQKMHVGIRESGLFKAFGEKGIVNKVFAFFLYLSPKLARTFYCLKK